MHQLVDILAESNFKKHAINYSYLMDFIFVFEYVLKEFQKENIDFAIIGGFALQAHGLARATQDIDFLVVK